MVTTNREPLERSLSPWLVVREAAARARCGSKVIYRAVRSGKLRAAQIGGRRELRFLPEWIDEWIDEWIMAQTVLINERARLSPLPARRISPV